MPNYIYYVKPGGTSTSNSGRVLRANARTSWGGTSTYYDSVVDVWTAAGGITSMAPGDIILVSSDLDESIGTSLDMECSSDTSIYSVSPSDPMVREDGAKISSSAAESMRFFIVADSIMCCYGVSFSSGLSLTISSASRSSIHMFGGTLDLFGSGKSAVLTPGSDGCALILHQTSIACADASNDVVVANGMYYELIDCGLTSGSTMKTLFKTTGAGGGSVVVRGGDYSILTISLSTLRSAAGGDVSNLYASGLLLGSGVPLESGAVAATGSKIEATSVGFGTATDTQNYFEFGDTSGLSTQDENVYRNSFSAKTVPETGHLNASPHYFKINTRTIDTADFTSTVTFTVHVGRAVGDLLTTGECWFLVEYQDGLDNAKTIGTLNMSLPSSTEDWTSESASGWTHNFTGVEGTDYKFQSLSSDALTIGSSAGNIASGPIVITMFYTGSDDIYTDIDVVAS